MTKVKSNLASILLAFTVVCAAASCKKNPVNNVAASSGSFTYEDKTMAITDADYRSGNGEGAWICLSSSDFNTVQIRFGGLADYVIPEGKADYVNLNYAMPILPNNNLKGAQVIINNVADEFRTGTVTVTKNANNYVITLIGITAKGKVTANFNGELKKI
ncbi:hypothetical protein ABIB40_001838 [Pedobacter sp. UYP30]|uniref:hypothetical protein n=1 Tax=Pedobacter sp. UYP30 TaxID=1756400 RepID=UPI0033995C0A